MSAPVLLQRYSFDGTLEGSGSLALALDSPTTTLGTAQYASGPIAGTQALSCVNKYVKLPPSPALAFTTTTPFSIGGWFYTTAVANGNQQAVCNYAPDGKGVMFGKQSYIFEFLDGALHLLALSGSPLLNTWSHMWLTYDGTTMTAYDNGVQVISAAVGAKTFATSSPWTVGYCAQRPTETATYKVADVRWYSGVVLPSVAMAPPPTGFTLTPTPYSCRANFPAVTGATSYKVQYTVAPSAEVHVVTDSSTFTSSVISGLTPGSVITVNVFATVASVQSLKYSGTVTLPAVVSAASFSKSALATPQNALLYDITIINSSNLVSKESVVNSLFTNGDRVLVTAGTNVSKRSVQAAVATVNSTVPVIKGDSIYIPFDSTSANTTQLITLTLRNGATESVSYNMATGLVTIRSVTYAPGAKLPLDGQTLSILQG